MSLVLGVFDGTHDAGACLIEDGTVIAACDEERWSRKKGQGGFPVQSIHWILTSTGLNWSRINHVSVAGFINPNPVLRMLRPIQQQWKLDEGQFYAPQKWFTNWIQFQSPFPKLIPKQNVSWRLFTKALSISIQHQMASIFKDNIPSVAIYEHHQCHAASAHFTSGHRESLIVVADGLGDGLALSIWLGSKHNVSKCFDLPYPHSLGLLYASVTGYLGYKPFRHEGKVTGLSARGNADNVRVEFPFAGPFPHRRITTHFPLYDWLQCLDNNSPEDIAAWLQEGIETEMIGIVRWAQIQFGNRPIVMAGGLVANVALNARISKEFTVPDLFIFPNMGDAGLAAGAAYLCGAEHFKWLPQKIQSVYWGPEITTSNISTTRLHDCTYRQLPTEDIIVHAGLALSEGKIVARAVGKMEYGPRALGHRSILCSARSKDIHRHLNTLLNRSETMPFAPIMKRETADRWLEIPEGAWSAAEWMTITVRAKPELINRCPAVVHVDGSLRPQLISQHSHPVLWKLLHNHESTTGEPALINTSFNRHEEPIVCTNDDAVQAFLESKLDALWLASTWIERKT